MVSLVVDSSVLIQNIRRGKELFFGILGKANLGKVKLIVPSVVLMEIWSGKSMENKGMERKIEARLAVFEKMNIDDKIAKKAGEVRRLYEVSGIDALIAACCLEHKAKLVTINVKHFQMVKGLKIYDINKGK